MFPLKPETHDTIYITAEFIRYEYNKRNKYNKFSKQVTDECTILQWNKMSVWMINKYK